MRSDFFKMNSFFNKTNLLHFVRELLWWIISAALTVAVLYPIISRLNFIHLNIFILFILVTLTYFRYCLMLSSLPFMRSALVRFIIFTFNLSLFVYLWHHEVKLLGMLDNFYTEDFGFPKVIIDDELKRWLFDYLRKVLTLFGTGSLLMLSAFQIRLIVSYWQYYTHKANNMMEH